MKRKLAVFDVDGTIFRASLTRSLFSALIEDERGVFPRRAAAEVKPIYESWLNRKGSYDAYIQKVVEVFMKYIKGVRQEDVRRVSANVILAEKHRTYRFTRDLIKELKRKDYFLVAISGSPYEIVKPYNRVLQFDKAYGWVLEVDRDGLYTGKMKHTYSVFEKQFLVKHVIEKYGATLKGSIGVGDSESDVSFLKLVERPIAFNPSSGLSKVAKKERWEIVVERKDVIYKI